MIREDVMPPRVLFLFLFGQFGLFLQLRSPLSLPLSHAFNITSFSITTSLLFSNELFVLEKSPLKSPALRCHLLVISSGKLCSLRTNNLSMWRAWGTKPWQQTRQCGIAYLRIFTSSLFQTEPFCTSGGTVKLRLWAMVKAEFIAQCESVQQLSELLLHTCYCARFPVCISS